MQDSIHNMPLYTGTWALIKYKNCNKTDISDEQLHAMKLSIHLFVKIPVESLEVEQISQVCRCTGSQSWCGGDRRNDWLWVKQHLGRCYGGLNGRLPWQLQ